MVSLDQDLWGHWHYPMESDNAYIATWGGQPSNTTSNHYELSQVFAKREDILSDCINLMQQIYFCGVIAGNLIRLET
jgi:hypothetical protein